MSWVIASAPPLSARTPTISGGPSTADFTLCAAVSRSQTCVRSGASCEDAADTATVRANNTPYSCCTTIGRRITTLRLLCSGPSLLLPAGVLPQRPLFRRDCSIVARLWRPKHSVCSWSRHHMRGQRGKSPLHCLPPYWADRAIFKTKVFHAWERRTYKETSDETKGDEDSSKWKHRNLVLDVRRSVVRHGIHQQRD
jgi:hypothetical protein